MIHEPRPIRSLAPLSVARLFSMWYGFWGLVEGLAFLFADAKRLNIPLGLFIPFVDFQLNIAMTRAPTFPGALSQAIFYVPFCVATGWLSGLLVAVAYNLAFKHFGFQLLGSTDTEPLSEN